MDTSSPTPIADRIRTLLAGLIGFDTVSDRSNLPLIAYIEDYLASFGIAGQRVADATGQKASLWVTIGPKDKPGIVLSGHTDVVPVEGQAWTHNPFEMIEREFDNRTSLIVDPPDGRIPSLTVLAQERKFAIQARAEAAA